MKGAICIGAGVLAVIFIPVTGFWWNALVFFGTCNLMDDFISNVQRADQDL